jgi:hypothetical protein
MMFLYALMSQRELADTSEFKVYVKVNTEELFCRVCDPSRVSGPGSGFYSL